eukprot:350097_1
MSHSQREYIALNSQDVSRLPCGILEKYVFATNRRELLSPKLDEDTKDNDAKQSDRKNIFISGSEDSIFYTMLHIENEIEKESIKSKDKYDNAQLNTLQKEFDELVITAEQKYEDKSQQPKSINDLIFRNRVRDIMSDEITKQYNSISLIEKEINPQYSHVPPQDTSKGIFSSVSSKRNYKEFITNDELQSKLDKAMKYGIDNCLASRDYNYYISNYFKNESLPFLLKQEKFPLKAKQNVLDNYYSKLLILCSNDNTENEETIMKWINDDINDEDKGYLRYGFRNIHSELTLEQMNILKTMNNGLLNVDSFIKIYLQKLMPLELGVYIGKNWNDIPIQMRWKYIKKLYDFVNHSDFSEINNNFTSLCAFIYYQYMIFIEQNYHLLNINQSVDDDEKKENEGLFDCAYDLDAIIKYIHIPKATIYNSQFRDKWYKGHNNKPWGD